MATRTMARDPSSQIPAPTIVVADGSRSMGTAKTMMPAARTRDLKA